MEHKLTTLHHLGIASANIAATEKFVRRSFRVTGTSGPVWDAKLNAELCLLETEGGPAIELVAGPAVTGLLKRRVAIYHVCYEVSALEATLTFLRGGGALPIIPPTPAILFGGRRVAFLQSPIGIIELLETAK